MNKHQKRKIDDENRKFQQKQKLNYFVIEEDNKIVCLIYNHIAAVIKEYNIKRYQNINHSTHNIIGDARNRKRLLNTYLHIF